MPAALATALLGVVLLHACAGLPRDEAAPGPATASQASTPSAGVVAATASRPPLASASPAPTASPTPGLRVTRTPAPAAVCPAATGTSASIELGPNPQSLTDLLEPQILHYLNAHGSAPGLQTELQRLRIFDDGWEPKKEASVLTIDVTGDSTRDLLVELVVHYSDIGGALFVFGCREGSVETLYRRPIGGAQHRLLGPEDGIVAVQDMNADGVAEVVIAEVTNISARGYATHEHQILEWDGFRFVELIPRLDGWSPAASFDAPGRIDDVERDGLLELRLPQAIVPEYPDSGPQRVRTDTWGWNGTVFDLMRSDFEEPTYRFQAVQDGDQATQLAEFDRALALYQQAITDTGLLAWSRGRLWPDIWYGIPGGASSTPTPDADEPLRLSAYARYRLLLLHAARGDLPEAQLVYDTMLDIFPAGSPGYPYARLAAAFWESFQPRGSLEEGCRAATEHAAEHAQEILEPLGSGFYGWFNRDYTPEDVCPF